VPGEEAVVTARIEALSEKDAINVQRFHMDVAVHDVCPSCGETVILDLADESYLSYPTVNTPFDLGMYCYHCQAEWSIKVKLILRLELA
jgi:hypothetical protein